MPPRYTVLDRHRVACTVLPVLLVGVFAWSVVATGFAWFGLLCLLFLAALDRHPSPAD